MPPGAYLVKAELDGFGSRRTASSCTSRKRSVSVSRSRSAGSGNDRGDRSHVAHHDRECDGRHRHREPPHRRTAAQRPQLPEPDRLEPERARASPAPGRPGDRQGGSRANQQISISGQRREFNYYTLDGVDNTDVNFNTYIFLPSVDALEEFKVQTGIYSAEFGRAAGQVNVVTKSGSNAFHGTVFEFHRNDALDSRPARSRPPRPPGKTRLQVESVRLRPAARSSRTACSSCRTSRATRTTRRS